MKKVFLFASAAIAALAMVSCNKEIEIRDQIAEGICPDGYYVEELVAEYPRDPETRTAFNETTGKFAWTEGDELAFHLSNGTYTSAPIDPATSKVKLYLPVGVTRNNYAVYPASAVVDEAAEVGNMQVTLPSTYDISGNLETEFVPMPLIATNDADNKKLKFEHVGALLQVNLNVPAGVKTAKLSMGKTITGTFDLAAGSGNGVIEAGAASDDALTFVLSEEGLTADFTTVKLLAPLPSGVYEKFEVAYDNGFAFTKDLSSKPWEFDRTQGKKVSIAEENFEDPTNYFYFKALEAGSVRFVKKVVKTLYYSYDKKEWNALTSTTEIPFEEGQTIWFYGECNSTYDYGWATSNYYVNNGRFLTLSGKYEVGGDILYLLNKQGERTTLPWASFYGLFYDCKHIVDASNLVLPDYTSEYCYGEMFYGNSELLHAPVLPALSVGKYAYSGMFRGCSKLISCPELPALESGGYSSMFQDCTSLTSTPEIYAEDFNTTQACRSMFAGCTSLIHGPSILRDTDLSNVSGVYSYMFQGCVNLVDCPVLPATDLGSSCYEFMFAGCENLPYAPELLAEDLSNADWCYYGMFSGCKSLTQAPVLPATKLSSYCYGSMFADCTNLVSVSDLPGEVLFGSSYQEMFKGCISLVNAPNILATSISNPSDVYGACQGMFMGCTSLVTPPSDLYPTTAGFQCYYQMFKDCVSLVSSPVIHLSVPETKPQYPCGEMFQGCSSLTSIKVYFPEWFTWSTWNYPYTKDWVKDIPSSGSFYCPVSLSLSYGVNYIPTGWTVYTIEEVGAGI